jgi:hypothetical protein
VQPSEIRRRILDDHETIRAMLVSVERVAREVLAGDSGQKSSLRFQGETLLSRLGEHMAWEDRYLRPALLDTPGFGEARAERLDRDHAEQRELLGYALASLADASRPALVVARNLLDLVALLRADMADEEHHLVSEKVLRDDVIATEVESG